MLPLKLLVPPTEQSIAIVEKRGTGKREFRRMGELEGINREITQNTAQRDQNRESEYGMLSNTEDRHTCNCSPIKRDTNGR